MNGLSLLYNFVFLLLGGLIVYVFKPFFGSYSAKKGENLATKEDIAQITKAQEEIKAQISDQVWDRQRQWEFKRDAVLDAVRALNRFDNTLIKLNSILSVAADANSDAAARREQLKGEEYLRYGDCCSAFQYANRVLDLVVGGNVSTSFRNYFQFADSLTRNVHNNQRFIVSAEITRELETKSDAFIQSAREALGIKEMN